MVFRAVLYYVSWGEENVYDNFDGIKTNFLKFNLEFPGDETLPLMFLSEAVLRIFAGTDYSQILVE